MTKFRDAGAYEVAEGVFSAEEAAKLGLAVVEIDPTSQAPTAYGRYKDAPSGAPLGITRDKPGDTEVTGGGQVSANADRAVVNNQKGSLVNLDDPFVRAPEGVETIHADGSEPGKVAEEIDDAPLREAAEKSIEQASKTTRKK